jgi:hypothetical protein
MAKMEVAWRAIRESRRATALNPLHGTQGFVRPGEGIAMFSGGMFQSMPGMREALTGPGPSREWLESAQERCQRRMHSTNTTSLQAEIDQLRVYMTALFRLLVARGVFTVEEAQQRVAELEAAGEPGGTSARDVMSGAERPPEENPFREMGRVDGQRRRYWWARIRHGVLAACLIGLTAGGVGIAWLVGWIQP